eukprot:jgi/Mesen1/3817/ME000207S02827
MAGLRLPPMPGSASRSEGLLYNSTSNYTEDFSRYQKERLNRSQLPVNGQVPVKSQLPVTEPGREPGREEKGHLPSGGSAAAGTSTSTRAAAGYGTGGGSAGGYAHITGGGSAGAYVTISADGGGMTQIFDKARDSKRAGGVVRIAKFPGTEEEVAAPSPASRLSPAGSRNSRRAFIRPLSPAPPAGKRERLYSSLRTIPLHMCQFFNRLLAKT